jgi:hypothetical protein
MCGRCDSFLRENPNVSLSALRRQIYGTPRARPKWIWSEVCSLWAASLGT